MPWLALISLVVAVEDDVVKDPAHVVFIISKNSYNTKPTVILHFSTLSPFWLKPTVQDDKGFDMAPIRFQTICFVTSFSHS